MLEEKEKFICLNKQCTSALSPVLHDMLLCYTLRIKQNSPQLIIIIYFLNLQINQRVDFFCLVFN